ncbi:hypothetical protein NliqN6_6364 [Naganishia liquefaciens]|uniref:Glutaredoxin domain-containing protein n=1 Tax=Naganishia liquefaciens TaxID=104408 RepID=A0A8H3TZF3_9TREE|nr:hypothetical protein NliqN6_6364 [Naganishia liquefaciens]
MAPFALTDPSPQRYTYGTPDSSPQRESTYPSESHRAGANAGYFPAFARSVTAAGQTKSVTSAASLFAVLSGPETPPLTPQRLSSGFSHFPGHPGLEDSPIMTTSLPLPASAAKQSSSWLAVLPRKATSRKSFKAYRKVLLSLAALLSILYIYNQYRLPASAIGGKGWASYLLPGPPQPKTFDFNERRLAGSREHMHDFKEHHVNAYDSAFPEAPPRGVSFVDPESESEFGFFAEDEMLEDGGETDEASLLATQDADQLSPAEKERRTRRKLEHALEIVAKRQEISAGYGRSLTSLADRNGLPDIYLEAIPALAETDISHPDISAEQVARLVDIVDHTRHVTLRTLIWYLSRGMRLEVGKTPVELDALMKKIWSVGGGRGLEIALKHAESESEDHGPGTKLEDRVFWDGWQDAAEEESHIAIFSKSYCPFSKRAKDIFTKYQLANPDLVRPVVFELDQRSDGPVIQSIVKRLTGRRTVPNVIVDHTSIGGADEVGLMDSEGSLRTLLMRAPRAGAR